MIKDHDMFNAVKNSISRCKQALLNNDVQAIHQWWVVGEGYDTFENMCYASYGPRFCIDDFGFLSGDDVKTIYDLDKENAKIISTALNTDDHSELHIALDNLNKIIEIYQM